MALKIMAMMEKTKKDRKMLCSYMDAYERSLVGFMERVPPCLQPSAFIALQFSYLLLLTSYFGPVSYSLNHVTYSVPSLFSSEIYL